jgi:hypothetical protein
MAKKVEFKLWYALSFAAQLGFLIVFPLVGFIWLGVYLDGRLATSPSFILLGLFTGLVITSYETYRLMEPLLEKENHKRRHK